jgi:hypothetical protein
MFLDICLYLLVSHCCCLSPKDFQRFLVKGDDRRTGQFQRRSSGFKGVLPSFKGVLSSFKGVLPSFKGVLSSFKGVLTEEGTNVYVFVP